ncbi:hypothetical protein N8I77_010562 [Diaporthe amygdali]|uniref:Uncharacterized protein n=1 Tax=Phomopsis amygdali TaxID=1214568 RepID=A0AAD9W154_PHOAM|nr:hypothetical protein N8I77_010562 [Diaporthe amygdali]
MHFYCTVQDTDASTQTTRSNDEQLRWTARGVKGRLERPCMDICHTDYPSLICDRGKARGAWRRKRGRSWPDSSEKPEKLRTSQRYESDISLFKHHKREATGQQATLNSQYRGREQWHDNFEMGDTQLGHATRFRDPATPSKRYPTRPTILRLLWIIEKTREFWRSQLVTRVGGPSGRSYGIDFGASWIDLFRIRLIRDDHIPTSISNTGHFGRRGEGHSPPNDVAIDQQIAGASLSSCVRWQHYVLRSVLMGQFVVALGVMKTH